MKTAPFPFNEEQRISDLHSYDILDSKKERDYDELIELASQITGCPIATISFVDRKRQWFKAEIKMCIRETSRDVVLCAHTILQKDVMVINDARLDSRFFDNPLITGEPHIVFYAGAPIISANGHVLGSVCAIDNKPRENFSEAQKRALVIIANQVSKLLDLRIKNKIIIKNATNQIASEKKNTHLAVTETENKHCSIAYQLHENLAQQLAGIKLFIESAEDSSNDLSFLMQKAKKGIGQLIIDIRTLSNSIVPTTFPNMNYFAVIEDFAIEYGTKNNIKISFRKCELASDIKSDIGLNLFRIIEFQLELSKKNHAKYIAILVKITDRIDIYVFDDGHVDDRTTPDNKTLYSKMLTRAEILAAELDRRITKNGNMLHIKIKKSFI